jgi:hypothetical protein
LVVYKGYRGAELADSVSNVNCARCKENIDSENARRKRHCVLSVRDVAIDGLVPEADLGDSEIVQLIIKHGRAEITELENGSLKIEFQNGYD